MPRELTKEQADFLLRVNTEEFREEARRNQEADNAAKAAAQATADANWARYRAERERRKRELKETLRPLMEAMRAAGIKLSLSSYEGVWGSYQIGNGPQIDIDLDHFDSFFEED